MTPMTVKQLREELEKHDPSYVVTAGSRYTNQIHPIYLIITRHPRREIILDWDEPEGDESC